MPGLGTANQVSIELEQGLLRRWRFEESFLDEIYNCCGQNICQATKVHSEDPSDKAPNPQEHSQSDNLETKVRECTSATRTKTNDGDHEADVTSGFTRTVNARCNLDNLNTVASKTVTCLASSIDCRSESFAADRENELLDQSDHQSHSRKQNEADSTLGLTTSHDLTSLSEDVQQKYKQALQCLRDNQVCDSLVFIDDALAIDGNCIPLLTLKAKVMNSMEDHLEALRAVAEVKVKDRSPELVSEGLTALQKLRLSATAQAWMVKHGLAQCPAIDDTPAGVGSDIEPGGVGKDGAGNTAVSETDADQRCDFDIQQQNGSSALGEKCCDTREWMDVKRAVISDLTFKGAPVVIKATELKRHPSLHATRQIRRNEVLFRETPHHLEQDIASCTISACANCGVSLVKPEEVFTQPQMASAEVKRALKKYWKKRAITPCDACKRVVFCCESCRSEAWESHHKAMCAWSPNTSTAMLYDVRKSFRDVLANDGSSWQGWWNAEFSPLFLARLLTTVLLRGDSEQKKESAADKPEKLKKVLEDLEKIYTLKPDRLLQPKESIPKMFELMANIFKRSRIARHQLSEVEFNSFYDIINANSIPFYDPEDALSCFIDKVTKDRKLHNKIGKYFQRQLQPRANFHGLFPLASCISHSCFPNVEISSVRVGERPGLSVRAIRDIAPGEEIAITLVDVRKNKSERSEILRRKYGIHCQCLRCEFEGEGPHQCTHCGQLAEESSRTETSIQATGDAVSATAATTSVTITSSSTATATTTTTKTTEASSNTTRVASITCPLSTTPSSIATTVTTAASPIAVDVLAGRDSGSSPSPTNVVHVPTEPFAEDGVLLSTAPSEVTLLTPSASTIATVNTAGTPSAVVVAGTTDTETVLKVTGGSDPSPASTVSDETFQEQEIPPSTASLAATSVTPLSTSTYTPTTAAIEASSSPLSLSSSTATKTTIAAITTTTTTTTTARPSSTCLNVNKELETSSTEESTQANLHQNKDFNTLNSGITQTERKENVMTPEVSLQGERTLGSIPEIKTQGEATPRTIPEMSTQGEATPSSISERNTQGEATPSTLSEINTQGEATPSTLSEINTQGEATPSSTTAAALRLFPHCSRCRRAWYCSSRCQKEAWVKGHKMICKKN